MCADKEKSTLCEEIDSSLCFKELPTQMIVKDFISGEINCNYEKYLLEFLNESKFFRTKSGGHIYTSPKSESEGEHDAISFGYSIDFKLLVSISKMESRSILSSSITKYADGVYGFGAPKSRNITQMKCTSLCHLLRYKTTKELEDIVDKTHRNLAEKDINIFLKTMRVKKNLLLFLPLVFYYEEERDYTQAVKEIKKAILFDLKASVKYRESINPELETYVATIYGRDLLIFIITSDCIELVDRISVCKSNTFNNLERYTEDFI